MNAGKLLVLATAAAAAVMGGAIYYLQVYGFYGDLPVAEEVALTSAEGTLEQVPVADFRGIDADSSPIRYRACFEIGMDPAEMAAAFAPYPQAEPLTAPGWFDCFDAAAIAGALRDGTAAAYLGQRDVRYGIDRVIAVAGDGRAWAWHQINACGAEVFDGREPPEGCPPEPAE